MKQFLFADGQLITAAGGSGLLAADFAFSRGAMGFEKLPTDEELTEFRAGCSRRAILGRTMAENAAFCRKYKITPATSEELEAINGKSQPPHE